MTRYTVIWQPPTEDHLAEIWVKHPDRRGAITAAANTIDHQLSSDSVGKGTPVHQGLQSLIVFPLQVLFSIEEADRIVRVARVKLPPVPPAVVHGAASQPGI